MDGGPALETGRLHHRHSLISLSGRCATGTLYRAFFTVPVPKTTGLTEVIGSITGGTNKSGADRAAFSQLREGLACLLTIS